MAGVLALAWEGLDFDDTGSGAEFVDLVEKPIRALAEHTLDLSSAIEGLVLPGRTISDRLTAAYREHLFGKATLQQLPEAPIFVINATNVGSGALLRFTRAYLADWRVGRIDDTRDRAGSGRRMFFRFSACALSVPSGFERCHLG